jgi:alpha 1,3-glucosidase
VKLDGTLSKEILGKAYVQRHGVYLFKLSSVIICTEIHAFVCRWYLMSSMLPLMRISSEAPLRDPLNLQSKSSRDAVKRALELRYSLLAYFYSLFHEANRTGVPVTRPMFFDFPADNATWTIDEQFMIGPALLACPAFYKNTVSVSVYLPKENTTWYHFLGGHKVNNGTAGLNVRVTSLTNELVLLMRGGFIVPSQVRWLMVFRSLNHFAWLVLSLRGKDKNFLR